MHCQAPDNCRVAGFRDGGYVEIEWKFENSLIRASVAVVTRCVERKKRVSVRGLKAIRGTVVTHLRIYMRNEQVDGHHDYSVAWHRCIVPASIGYGEALSSHAHPAIGHRHWAACSLKFACCNRHKIAGLRTKRKQGPAPQTLLQSPQKMIFMTNAPIVPRRRCDFEGLSATVR